MIAQKPIIFFKDHIGQFPPGQLFYPESLKFVTPALTELCSKQMSQPRYFNANVQEPLNFIIGYFEGIREMHEEALSVYEAYRTEGIQYCLYLRSFVSSGLSLYRNLESNVHTFGWSGDDRSVARLVKATLDDQINCISFVNTHDFHVPRARNSEFYKSSTIPSFRVLSHNWRENVAEVIRGAKLIVLYLESQTDGVMLEVDLIRECNMVERTICITDKPVDRWASALSDFRNVIVTSSFDPTSPTPQLSEFRDLLKNLAVDKFSQSNQIKDLSELDCYVLDRHIELAASQCDPQIIAEAEYRDYIPSSLHWNWVLLGNNYLALLKKWKDVEKTIAERQMNVGTTADVMYEALHTFCIAVTLESYYEMATTMWIVALAHKLITGTNEIKDDCLRHAVKCSTWCGDNEFATACRDLSVQWQ